MKKFILFLFLLLSSFNYANCDYLYSTLNVCVSDYYYKPSTGTLYYIRSDNNTTYTSTTKSTGTMFFNGWDYNATTGFCTREKSNNPLGLENGQYTYLMGLTGLLLGFGFTFGLYLIFSRK